MGHGGRDGRERSLYLVVPPIDDSLPTWTETDLDREALEAATPVEHEGNGGGSITPSRGGFTPPASVPLPTCNHRGELHLFTETCSCGHTVNSYSSLEGSV